MWLTMFSLICCRGIAGASKQFLNHSLVSTDQTLVPPSRFHAPKVKADVFHHHPQE